MRQSSTLDIGWEVYTDAMAVASIAPEHGAEGISLGASGTRPCAIAQRLRTRPSQAPPRIVVDAAGPCGAWLSRYVTKQGEDGWVVAPARGPTPAGARVKTDRRDARPRARLARAGALPGVSGPTVDDAALRDRTRAREETRSALQDATCRRHACCLRDDRRDSGRAPWRPAPRRWRSAVVCPTPAPPSVWHADVRAVNEHTARLPRLAPARPAHVQAWRWPLVVETLQAWRGGHCPVAVTLVAEVGDRSRVDPPRARLKCVGWIPAA
jgi:transposase